MKTSKTSKRYFLILAVILPLLLCATPTHADWWGQVKVTTVQSWEKTKELSLRTVRASKQASHKSWESALYGTRFTKQAASKSWAESKAGWHHFKLLIKP